MSTAARPVRAIVGLLALQAKLHIWHGVQAPANRLLAFSAESKELRLVFQSREGLVDSYQSLGARTVSFGRYDLAHFDQRLLVLVAAHASLVLAHGLDRHIAFGEDLGSQSEQSFLPLLKLRCVHGIIGCHRS